MDMLRRYLVLISLGVASIGTVSGIALCDVCECSPERDGLHVDCTGKHLTELPELVPKNISVLNLSDNKLTSIPEDALLGLDSLTQLFLDNNSLRKLPNLPKLIQAVHAVNNCLTEVDAVLQNLPNIDYLKLPRNNIMRIREDAFNGSTILSHIDLEGNSITTIDLHAFRGLEEITNVKLSHNRLEALPTNVFDLNQEGLIEIFLSNNKQLENLPPRTFNNSLSGYASLYLQHCGLKSIANGTFDGCGHIVNLVLSYNHIAWIDEEAFNYVVSIHGLFLDNNNLTRISPTFRFCSITFLYLNFNNITSLGSETISSDETQVIMLTRNKIESISKANFNGMKSLTVLMVALNNISHIDELAFNGTNLTALYLYGNQLDNIPQTTFQMTGRSNLASLYMHGNPISTVDEECFANVDLAYITCENLHMIPTLLGGNVTVHCVFENSTVKLNGLGNVMPVGHIITQISGAECNGTPPTCKFCRRGSFGSNDGRKTICLKCPPGGYYQDMMGYVKTGKYTTDCKPCPNGTFSEKPGAASKGDCLACPVGTQTNAPAGLNACDCLPMFHRVNRYGSCTPCPPEGVNCSGGYQQLQNGFWWSWEFESTCQQFGSNAEYDGFINGLKNTKFDVQKPKQLKDVMYNGSLPAVHQCPRSRSCISSGTSAMCAEGYEGWLCVVCKMGYYSLFNECHQCPKLSLLILMYTFFILLSILLVYMTLKYENVLRRKYDKLKVNSLTMYVKIAINYYQIIGILSIGTLTLSNDGNVLIYLDIVGYINLLSPRCVFQEFRWNAYKQSILSICVPVAIIAIGAVATIIIKIKRRQNDDGSSLATTDSVFSVVLLLLYFTYASCCTGIMAIGPWTYRTFNTTADGECTRKMINSDYSIIVSNETNHKSYELLCYCSLLYVAGFPIALFCILFNLHRRGIIGRCQNYQPIQGTGSSLNQYIPVDDIDNDDDDTDDNGHHNDDDDDTDDNDDDVVHDHIHTFDSAQVPQQSLSFFYAQYTTRCWFWEVLELCTKAALALIVNYVGYQGVDVAYSILVIVFLVLLHVHFRPIKDTLAQRFQITTLIFVIVNIAVNFILSLPLVDDASTTQYMACVILNCINASIIIVAIVALIQTFFRHSIWKLAKNFTSMISKIVRRRDSIP